MVILTNCDILRDAGTVTAFAVAAIGIFAMTRQTPRRQRVWLIALLAIALVTPLLIPPQQRVARLFAAVLAVVLSMKAYDLSGDESARSFSATQFLIYLFNPFCIVRRLVDAERKPSPKSDWRRLAFNTAIGLVAISVAIRIFRIDWQRHSMLFERSAKTFAVFFIIQFIPNAMAALSRRLGIRSTDFGGLFIFARTPAEFWRIYNRPAEQFFRAHVFDPAGGRRRIVIATLATFLVSALVHEYVFDTAASRVLGNQLLFFSVQGVAVLATARLRPCGAISVLAIAATLAFNVLTGTLFLSGFNTAFPLWTTR